VAIANNFSTGPKSVKKPMSIHKGSAMILAIFPVIYPFIPFRILHPPATHFKCCLSSDLNSMHLPHVLLQMIPPDKATLFSSAVPNEPACKGLSPGMFLLISAKLIASLVGAQASGNAAEESLRHGHWVNSRFN
jgi:hypothetical protein